MRFVDTSSWLALPFRRDRHHGEARALWRDQTQALITTNHVLGETWTFLRRRLGHRPALDFADRVARSQRLTVHGVDEATEREAGNWLRRHDERAYSYVDATSFAVSCVGSACSKRSPSTATAPRPASSSFDPDRDGPSDAPAGFFRSVGR